METMTTVAPMLKSKSNTDKRHVTVIRKDSAKTATKLNSSTAAKQIVAKTSEKQAKTARPAPLYVQLITKMVSEAKWSRKEIIEAVAKACEGVALSSIQTVCTDCKNPKYNRLPQLVDTDGKGIMHFVSK
jgi:hypothetical protein